MLTHVTSSAIRSTQPLSSRITSRLDFRRHLFEDGGLAPSLTDSTAQLYLVLFESLRVCTLDCLR